MRFNRRVSRAGCGAGALNREVPDVGTEFHDDLGARAPLAPPTQNLWFPALLAQPVQLLENEGLGADKGEVRLIRQGKRLDGCRDPAAPHDAEQRDPQTPMRIVAAPQPARPVSDPLWQAPYDGRHRTPDDECTSTARPPQD